MPCIHEKICVLGGKRCEGYCPEEERLNNLEKEKCPIMVTKGYQEDSCACDMPLLLRALIPHYISCAIGDKCIIAIYFPELRSKAYAGKLDLTPHGINSLAAEIKLKLRTSIRRQPKQATA